MNYEFLTFHWWILVALLVIPWVIWFMIVDRKRLLEILLLGTLIIIPTTILDAMGADFNFWAYPTQLVPVTPRAIPFDMSMVPVGFMLLYQYFTTKKSFFIAVVLMSGLYAFVGELWHKS